MRRGDVMKDDSGSYAVFTEQGSSASHMTAAKVLFVISSLPEYVGQASEHGRRAKVIGITRIRVPSYLDSCTAIPPPKNMARNSRPSSTTRKTGVRTPVSKIAVGATIRKGLGRKVLGESSKMGMFIHAPRKGLVSLRLCGRVSKEVQSEPARDK